MRKGSESESKRGTDFNDHELAHIELVKKLIILSISPSTLRNGRKELRACKSTISHDRTFCFQSGFRPAGCSDGHLPCPLMAERVARYLRKLAGQVPELKQHPAALAYLSRSNVLYTAR